jgi:hypothetical protein
MLAKWMHRSPRFAVSYQGVASAVPQCAGFGSRLQALDFPQRSEGMFDVSSIPRRWYDEKQYEARRVFKRVHHTPQ